MCHLNIVMHSWMGITSLFLLLLSHWSLCTATLQLEMTKLEVAKLDGYHFLLCYVLDSQHTDSGSNAQHNIAI